MCIIYKPRRLKEPLSTRAFILKENSKFSVKEGRMWEARKNYIFYYCTYCAARSKKSVYFCVKPVCKIRGFSSKSHG